MAEAAKAAIKQYESTLKYKLQVDAENTKIDKELDLQKYWLAQEKA